MRLEFYSKEDELFLLCNTRRVLGIAVDGYLLSFYSISNYKLARVYMHILLNTNVYMHSHEHIKRKIVLQLVASLVVLL